MRGRLRRSAVPWVCIALAWAALPALAGPAPLPIAPKAPPIAEAPDAPAPEAAEPAERTKLLIVPDEVLDEAARDRQSVTIGSHISGVSGNAARYRRYWYPEPTRLAVLEELRASGTAAGRDAMYELSLHTPGLARSSADLVVRGFSDATSLRFGWNRDRFYRDFSPSSGTSSREEASASLRLRLSGEGWVDVSYRGRLLSGSAGTARPVAFRTDEFALDAVWLAGDVVWGATLTTARYLDGTAAIGRSGRQLRANRSTVKAGVSVSSRDAASLQWRAAASYRATSYPSLGGQSYVGWSTAAGLQYRVDRHLLLSASAGWIGVPRTITTNTYTPEALTWRVGGTYTGLRSLRASFGFERRTGTRYSLRPVVIGDPEGFIEAQTKSRAWLTGRLRNRGGLMLEGALRYRVIEGDVSHYLGPQVATAPILLWPEQTVASLTASYPAGSFGLVSAGVRLGRNRNPARDASVQSYGVTALWTRTFSGRWSTLFQYDRARYASSAGAGGVDITLSGITGSATWSLRRWSVTGGYSSYRLAGTSASHASDARLSLAYRASDRLNLRVQFSRQVESGVPALAYAGQTVIASGQYEF